MYMYVHAGVMPDQGLMRDLHRILMHCRIALDFWFLEIIKLYPHVRVSLLQGKVVTSKVTN